MDIEKFSNLEVDTASTKSISDACNEMKKLETQIEDQILNEARILRINSLK